jgi:hypothetical protein
MAEGMGLSAATDEDDVSERGRKFSETEALCDLLAGKTAKLMQKA